MQVSSLVFSAVALLTPIAAQAQTIGAVQGAGHRSTSEGGLVSIEGIVTSVRPNGFYLQGQPDRDDGTSDGIFVFTGEAAAVEPGDSLIAEGTVVEFTPQSRPNQLSLTELGEPEFLVIERGLQLPEPMVLGAPGFRPPTETIDDDSLTLFEPGIDGIDFFESLEGMRVTIHDAMALSTVNDFDEVWVVASKGDAVTGLNGSALVMTADDQNPERILVDLGLVDAPAGIEAGTELGNISGVMTYAFGNYRLEASGLGDPIEDRPMPDKDGGVTIGSYNVENLDPKIESRDLVGSDRDVDDDIGAGKFTAIARQIVETLGSPAILALQEVQDNDGAEQTPLVSAEVTLSHLADEIAALGGPAYYFIDLPPVDDQDGGQPGGNIRVAYLFDPLRISPIAGGARRILDTDLSNGDAFKDTRKPLLAAFETSSGPLVLINVHLSSRGGSDPAFGLIQPPSVGSKDAREAQTAVIGSVVDGLLAADAEAQIIVLGDFNAFYFEDELTALEAEGRLANLWRTLHERARYSYIFEGQAQALDHVFVSPALGERARLEAIHINAGRLDQASDHDPLLVMLIPRGGSDPGSPTPPDTIGLDLPVPPAGLEGEDLRNFLRANWYGGRYHSVGYNSARRAMYSQIDANEAGRVVGVYSGFSQPAADVTFLDPINAEHTVPQSWFSQRDPMRSDIHNLFPTHKDVNAARGSEPFGEIPDAITETWYGLGATGGLAELSLPPSSDRDAFGEDRDGEFEPPEAQKGDTARAIFYFYTMYPGEARTIEDIAADGVAQLGAWNRDDPPDGKERERNRRIEAIQGNRNPFVDLPDLVCRAFAEACP